MTCVDILNALPGTRGQSCGVMAFVYAQRMQQQAEGYQNTAPKPLDRARTRILAWKAQGDATRLLDLSDLDLPSVPEELWELEDLRHLDLHGNAFHSLPAEIRRLKDLAWLDVRFNALANLPLELLELPGLAHLFLQGNPQLRLPAEMMEHDGHGAHDHEVVETSPQALLDYYFERREHGEATLHEARVLLVGRGGPSKAGIIQALIGQAVDRGQGCPGILNQPLVLKCHGKDAVVQVWDFGEHEHLHTLRSAFLRSRSIYLLVLEERENFWDSEADHWMRFIQNFAGESPVVVVLTRYAGPPDPVDRNLLKARCPNIVDFVEVDAFTSKGVRRLRSLLEQTVAGMKDVWVGMPRRWHSIWQEVAASPEPVMNYACFRELCARHQIENARHQAHVRQMLDRLGLVLDMECPRQAGHGFLMKRAWVTQAIYGLLRHCRKQGRQALLRREDLALALTARDYPEKFHEHVMNVLTRFEIACPAGQTQAVTGGDEESWLLPELLRDMQPAGLEDFDRSGCTKVRFTYPEALPPGLLARLIVRTHRLSAAQSGLRWRGGVVLEWGRARALARLDRRSQRLHVLMCPTDQYAEQSLFDLIRAELRQLHGTLPVVEEMELPSHSGTWLQTAKLRLLEQRGTKECEEMTPAQELISFHVGSALDVVESSAVRRAKTLPAARLYVCCAHVDRACLDALLPHLKLLSLQGYIHLCNEHGMALPEGAGGMQVTKMDSADIILMLYSRAARLSQFIQEREAPRALKLQRGGVASMLVVPLDFDRWDESNTLEMKLKRLKQEHWRHDPVLSHRPVRAGWAEVENRLRAAVDEWRQKQHATA